MPIRTVAMPDKVAAFGPANCRRMSRVTISDDP